jgi:hypothetical protein
MRLCISNGVSGRYCALSHCWGRPSSGHFPARTTKATLESNQIGIDEGSLSKAFREAIAAARHLSIDFMWIDSLCITQDDKEDWERESSNMASIYKNAWLVIAATQAKHSGIGCFTDCNDKITPCFDIPLINGKVAPVFLRHQRGSQNYIFHRALTYDKYQDVR